MSHDIKRDDFGGIVNGKSTAAALRDNKLWGNITFSDLNIGNKAAIAIAEGLRYNETVNGIDLSSNNIKDEGAIALAEALKYNKSLKSLSLTSNEIGDEGGIAFAESLGKYNRTLTELDLSRTRIGDGTAKKLASMIKENSVLTNLNISHSAIGSEGQKSLSRALRKSKGVRTLEFDGNNVIVATMTQNDLSNSNANTDNEDKTSVASTSTDTNLSSRDSTRPDVESQIDSADWEHEELKKYKKIIWALVGFVIIVFMMQYANTLSFNINFTNTISSSCIKATDLGPPDFLPTHTRVGIDVVDIFGVPYSCDYVYATEYVPDLLLTCYLNIPYDANNYQSCYGPTGVDGIALTYPEMCEDFIATPDTGQTLQGEMIEFVRISISFIVVIFIVSRITFFPFKWRGSKFVDILNKFFTIDRYARVGLAMIVGFWIVICGFWIYMTQVFHMKYCQPTPTLKALYSFVGIGTFLLLVVIVIGIKNLFRGMKRRRLKRKEKRKENPKPFISKLKKLHFPRRRKESSIE